MAGIRFDGVRFSAFSDDHVPMHVHARYAGVEVVIDLLPEFAVDLSSRKDAVRPANAKQSDVKYILQVAAERYTELTSLWRQVHGNSKGAHYG